jgi:hypothetical protein
MTALENSAKIRKLPLELLAPQGAWEAVLLPVTEFPLPVGQRASLMGFVKPLTTHLRDIGFQHQTLLQTWKLGPDSGTDVLTQHHREWRQELGLGVWPARVPPRGWTEENMMDAVAAVFRGDEPELPSHRVLRLRPKSAAGELATHDLRGFGAQIDIFSKNSPQETDQQCKTYYLTRMEQERFREEDFYIPLLDRRSFAQASQDNLEHWMCGIDFYMRESAEDRGLLLISRLPLRPLFENAGLL